MSDQSTDSVPAHLAKERTRAALPRRLLAKRLMWSVVEASIYRYSFHTLNGFRAGLLRCFGASIGKHCTIRRTSRVYYPWNLTMGNLSCLGDRAEVYNLGQVTLGDRVTLSQESYVCAGTHDYTKLSMPLLTPPVTIADDVWIGARAFVGPSVTLNTGVIVAAGSVVVKDAEAWTVVGGNPAMFIKHRTPFSEGT